MISAAHFVRRAKSLGFTTYSGVPCSYLRALIDETVADETLRYVGASNEGDAVAIAAGAELGGQLAVAMMQNSGLSNAISPLTSLTHTFEIPILVIVSQRGAPDGPPDEPQHQLVGKITGGLLDLLEIPWSFLPDTNVELDRTLERAAKVLRSTRRPYALVVKKGTIHGEARPWRGPTSARRSPLPVTAATATMTRGEALRCLKARARPRDILIASTGYTGRELSTYDAPNQLYMVGSMGCASSLGLGLALARPDTRVIVIDGDGAALMRLGAMCTVGHERPANLLHVLLDNGMHESTGGQATVSGSVDFCGLAAASGYPWVTSVSTHEALAEAYSSSEGQLAFIHVPIRPGTPQGLPRPQITPPEVAERLRVFLRR